jgi:alpha-L-arabinofuranosidase
MTIKSLYTFALLTCSIATWAQQKPYSLVVKANQPKADVQPTMWGVFFEDINFGADGGLYAELVKNRSFEFDAPLMGWKELKSSNAVGRVLMLNRGESQANPRVARVTVSSASEKYGLQNEGFRGMGIKKDVRYHFSLWAKPVEGNVSVAVELVDAQGKVIGSGSVPLKGTEGKKYEVSFKATATEAKGRLNVWFSGQGVVDVDMISLFPSDTWKQRPQGLRADLVQMLADMKPGFLRFPGGCIVEGRDLANRYQWKKTIGKTEDRKLIINRWNTEFKHRPAPDYFQSYGLGFYEYFMLAEDIGAEPLPIINCGMACQFNTAEVVPLEQVDTYLQDALDLIEFANGGTDTPWGKVRADLGHSKPFNLKLLGIGNEQWGPQYVDRYKEFAKAIKEKYPSIKLVTSVGPGPEGELFEYLNPTLRSLHADILDEHYYQKPEWFLQHADRYDNYDRNGPKIFAGEYAAQSLNTVNPDNKNTWLCALSEAAFMTGLERNADVVYMASYAPLFAHAEGWQWTPDLIWFDNLRAYGTPNYYVQKMFSTNKGTKVVPILANDAVVAGKDGLYASAVRDDRDGSLILKVVNNNATALPVEITLEGVPKASTTALSTVIRADQADAVNSFESPKWVSPIEKAITFKGKKIVTSLAPSSFTVIRVAGK